MENKRSRVDELKSILSSTKAKDEMRLLHIISLSKIMDYSELADTDKLLEWVEVLVETISDPKLELFEQTYKGVFDESEQTAWRDNLDEDVNMVISLNKNIISNVGSDSLYRKKLKKVFSLVNRPGVILRAGLSHEQMELMSTLQTPMIALRQMYVAEPRKYMDYLIEAYKDSNFSSILRMFDEVESEKERIKELVVAIFDIVCREFSEIETSVRVKITGYICGVIGVFDSEEEHNEKSRRSSYSVYLVTTARNRLRSAGLI